MLWNNAEYCGKAFLIRLGKEFPNTSLGLHNAQNQYFKMRDIYYTIAKLTLNSVRSVPLFKVQNYEIIFCCACVFATLENCYLTLNSPGFFVKLTFSDSLRKK